MRKQLGLRNGICGLCMLGAKMEMGPTGRALGLIEYGACPDTVVFSVYDTVITSLNAGAMKRDEEVDFA